MLSLSQLITILVWKRNLLGFNFEHFHCPRRPNSKNLSREIQTSRQTVHEYQTVWNPHHGSLSTAEFLPYSGQPCIPSNTRRIDGQSICTGTLWISRSFSRILFFQSLSVTQFPLCGQSYHDALSRLETTPTMGHLYSTWLLHSTHSTRRSWWFRILGCHISTEQRSITIRQPLDLVTLRSGHSQDSDTAILSAFRARSLLIIRYAHPKTLIIPQIEDLLAIFDRIHIRRNTLRPTIRTLVKFLKRRLLPD